MRNNLLAIFTLLSASFMLCEGAMEESTGPFAELEDILTNRADSSCELVNIKRIRKF